MKNTQTQIDKHRGIKTERQKRTNRGSIGMNRRKERKDIWRQN